jgi:hypothetical protein
MREIMDIPEIGWKIMGEGEWCQWQPCIVEDDVGIGLDWPTERVANGPNCIADNQGGTTQHNHKETAHQNPPSKKIFQENNLHTVCIMFRCL